MKALGLFFSKKVANSPEPNDKPRVVPNDKISSAEGSDYELAIKKLTFQANK